MSWAGESQGPIARREKGPRVLRRWGRGDKTPGPCSCMRSTAKHNRSTHDGLMAKTAAGTSAARHIIFRNLPVGKKLY
jgi:hypothetical protein